MARQSQKRFSPKQKLKIIKEGMRPNVRVADLCRYYDIDRRITTKKEE